MMCGVLEASIQLILCYRGVYDQIYFHKVRIGCAESVVTIVPQIREYITSLVGMVFQNMSIQEQVQRDKFSAMSKRQILLTSSAEEFISYAPPPPLTITRRIILSIKSLECVGTSHEDVFETYVFDVSLPPVAILALKKKLEVADRSQSQRTGQNIRGQTKQSRLDELAKTRAEPKQKKKRGFYSHDEIPCFVDKNRDSYFVPGQPSAPAIQHIEIELQTFLLRLGSYCRQMPLISSAREVRGQSKDDKIKSTRVTPHPTRQGCSISAPDLTFDFHIGGKGDGKTERTSECDVYSSLLHPVSNFPVKAVNTVLINPASNPVFSTYDCIYSLDTPFLSLQVSVFRHAK